MSGTITFTNYPSSNRVPGVYVEVNAGGGVTQVNQPTLLIGQMLSSGTGVANEPIVIASASAANTLFGNGSQLALMVSKYLQSDNFGELWVLPLEDNTAGTATVVTVSISGTSTASGTLNLYVSGYNVQAAVANGASSGTIATALANAITQNVNLPCTASVAGSVLTLTAKHKGVAAGDIDVRMNYNGEVTPAGISVSISSVAGTADPDLATAFGNLGDQPFDFIANPYSGTPELDEVVTLLNDVSGRWSWSSMIFGGAFTAQRVNSTTGKSGALAAIEAIPNLNNQHVSIMPFYDSPSSVSDWTVAYTAAAAVAIRSNPALPLHTLVLNVLAPPVSSRFNISSRNSIDYAGFAAYKVVSNTVTIDRALTTYLTNEAGVPDASYLDVTTLYKLMYGIRYIANDLGTKFARAVIVPNGTPLGYGNGFVTPNTVLNEVIADYTYLCGLGIFQNAKTFATNAAAQNAGNGQISLYLPVDVTLGLETIACNITFITG